MARRTALVLALLVLTASSAQAGGFATAGLAPPPDDISAGDVWDARVTLLQHGVTPLDGVRPSVTIRSGSEFRTFKATPTGEPGKYVARVTFPTGGDWRYEVDDGFGNGGRPAHTFAPITVGGASGDGGPAAWWFFLGLPLVAAAALALRRRSAHRPARVLPT